MSQFPEIFVLRHGQTEWNTAGRHQGRMDSPLTEHGRGQARMQSGLLAALLQGRDDPGAFSSPQGRACDTADIVLRPLGMSASTDARLCEISFGQWEGLTFDEIAQGWPELTKDADKDVFGWHFHAPGGEAFEDVSTRARQFLESLSRPSIIVTHGITSRIMRGIWLGQGWDEMAAMPGGQGCVYHLRDGKQRRFPLA